MVVQADARADVPNFIYGTAWKEERTEELTRLALAEGFRAIDTANQRKHYHEVAVGQALRGAFAGGLKRADVFVQSKFTYRGGQDTRLPYDPRAPVAEQLQQSFASSLEHLGCGYLDSYLLHGPERRRGISANDWRVWEGMTDLKFAGKVRQIGVSNVTFEQLKQLCDGSSCAPDYVQNRCYATMGWDRDVRLLCAQRGIVYQGFSLLTANRAWLRNPQVLAAARNLALTPAQLTFCMTMRLGVVPLTGTSQAQHMRQDLSCHAALLGDAEHQELMVEVGRMTEI